MKKIIYILFATVMFFSQLTFSQEKVLTEDQILNSLRKNELHSSFSNNEANINQDGQNNTGIVNQVKNGIYGGNLSNISQSGIYNEALLLQYGSGNTTNINQDGNYNYAEIDIIGHNIYSEINQSGNHNYIDQNFSGSGMNFSVQQQGNNNELIQNQSGNDAVNYKITQNGNGISTVINNGLIIIK